MMINIRIFEMMKRFYQYFSENGEIYMATHRFDRICGYLYYLANNYVSLAYYRLWRYECHREEHLFRLGQQAIKYVGLVLMAFIHHRQIVLEMALIKANTLLSDVKAHCRIKLMIEPPKIDIAEIL